MKTFFEFLKNKPIFNEVEKEDLEHHKIIDKIEDGVEGNFDDYYFNDLFGNRLRIVIPLGDESSHLNDTIVSRMLARQGYDADLDKGTAEEEIKTQKGNQIREIKLGKLFKKLSKFDPEWRNVLHWWEMRNDSTKEMGDPSGVSIIISRSPIDIIRMSDHDEWRSCHAPPGKPGHTSSYWPCSGQEARTGGAIAYVVRNRDLQEVDDLQAADIFKDNDRDIDGVKPLERLRLRRFKVFDYNKKDKLDILVPEKSTYGIRHVGFYDTVAKWAKEAQSKNIDFENPPDWETTELHGGSYQDTPASSIWNYFFGTNVRGSKNSKDVEEEAEHGGESAASMEASAQEQLNAHELEYVIVGFQVEYDEYPTLYHWGHVAFEFPEEDFNNIPEESDFEDIWRYEYWHLQRDPSLRNKKNLGAYIREELDWLEKEGHHSVEVEGGKVKITLEIERGDYAGDLDGFEYFLDVCDNIDDNYTANWATIKKVLINRGFMKEQTYDDQYQNFEIDEDYEWIESNLIWIGDLNGVDSKMISNHDGNLLFLNKASSMQANAMTIFPKYSWLKPNDIRFKVEGPRIGSWETPTGVIQGDYKVYLNLLIFTNPINIQEIMKDVKHLDQYWAQYQNRAGQWWKIVKPNLVPDKPGTYAALSQLEPVKEKEPGQQQLELPFKDWLVLSGLKTFVE
jgi:hypothetical protein